MDQPKYEMTPVVKETKLMAERSGSDAPESGQFAAGDSALIVHSSDDEVDNPVLPVLVETDGHPSGLGRTLWTLVRRDGYDVVLSALGRGGLWIHVAADASGEAVEPKGGVFVPGYGVHHPKDDVATLARIEKAMEDDGMWWYVVERHGMVIDCRFEHERRQVGFVAWADPEPVWPERP